MADLYTTFCEPVGGVTGPLVKIRPAASSDTDKIVSGRVVSLDNDGNFALGLTKDGAMPAFVFRGTEAPSVYDALAGTGKWISSSYGSNVMAFVATGGFELQTTEFDGTQTYYPNDPLTVDNTTGKLTNQGATLYAVDVVGICSVHENPPNNIEPFKTGEPPCGRNANLASVLTFWPVYLPKKPT